LLDVLPDNKIVEDVHNCIRKDAKKTPSSKRSTVRVQDVVTASKVLEERNIVHTSPPTKQDFVRNFHSARACGGRLRHYCVAHKLPVEWAKLMGRKTWHTSSEASCRKCIAAWEWLQVGHPCLCNNAGLPAPTLDSAMFSRMVLPEMVLRHVQTGKIQASLGNASWAVLFWPIDVLSHDADGMRTMQFGGHQAKAFFGHVTDPLLWEVITYRVERTNQGIVLQQVGAPDSLVRACLLQRHGMTHADLVRLAAHLGTGSNSHDSRQQLLNALASHVSEGDISFLERVCKADQSEKKQKGQRHS